MMVMKAIPINEDLFVKQINEKHVKAFHRLFERFYSSLVAFSLRYVPDREVGEDIVQDFFVQLWESDNFFPSYNHLRNYLYTSVRNACLNYLKHVQVEKKYIDYCLESTEEEEELDLSVAREELYRLLFQVIEELPARRKEIFQLYIEGKTNVEIAEMLNISTETVKTAKKESMRYIREKLGHLFVFLIIFELLS